MFRFRYDVRVIENGKLVTKKRFVAKDKALNFARDKLIRRRQVRLTRVRAFVLTTFSNASWGISPHAPWERATGPMRAVFLHTSVTKQLPISASLAAEKEQMRLLDRIAHSRGFNGISYSWAIFPSGRCYEGRGDFVIEAATEGFNTSTDSIVFVGNGDTFGLTEPQRLAAIAIINRKQTRGVFVRRGLDVRGHREISTQGKSCPGKKITDTDIQRIQLAVNA